MGQYSFRLPDVGEGVVEAEIVAWHVNPGDTVAEDQPLVDVMTDKATVEITSPVSGVVLSANGVAGDMAAVGSTLVVFETEGGARPAASASAGEPAPAPQIGEEATLLAEPRLAEPLLAEPPASGAPPRPIPGGTAKAPGFFRSEGDHPLTSPAIRRRARELGVRLETVRGSGPEGRITREDFEAHVDQAARPAAQAALSPAAAPASSGRQRDGVEEVRIIGLRRRIAEKMQDAKRRIPHFAYVEEMDVTELDALRAHLNARWAGARPKLSFLPFLIRALTQALPEFPQINATYDDEAGVLKRHAAVHLGMATQTPNGLMVPVIRHAEARDLWDLSGEIARLAAAARAGSASREELSGSTITLTSLGTLGGVAHTPVINAPEVAIVGPNRIIERPVVRDGAIAVRKMMNLSASFDHRIVDGFDAASFIQRIKGLLEFPATLFMD